MKYDFIINIGQGGCAIVDKVLGEDGVEYAMKTFHIHPMFNYDMATVDNLRKRFIKEARVQKSIDHRNVVPILDENLNIAKPYYIMPLAVSTLAEDIQNKVVTSVNFQQPFNDVLNGMEEIHSLGICHRDLKPQNVLMFEDVLDGDYYAVSDFGFLSLNETKFTTLTQTGMAKGTDWYTAPEVTQDLKKATIKSDIYSLGCILHDLVGESSRIPCNEIRDISPYGSILSACTRTDIKRRFKNVASLREALLTIGSAPAITLKSNTAKNIALLLEKGKDFTESEIVEIADYIESNFGSEDCKSVIANLRLNILEEVVKIQPQSGSIGKNYAKYVRDRSFQWDDCDVYANRLEIFIKTCDIDVKADCVMALLYMGTSHNRWHVERKFTNYTGKGTDENFIKRICVELTVDDYEACSAISHLTRSINFLRSDFHPLIVEKLNHICH